MVGTERESGIGGMGGVAAYGVASCVFHWAGVGIPCDCPLECAEEAGDFEGDWRLTSARGSSGASEEGRLTLEAPSSVEGWWVEVEWSDTGRGEGLRRSTVCVSLGSSLILVVSFGGEGAGRAS